MDSVIARKGRWAFLLLVAAALLILLVVTPATAKAEPQPLAGGATYLTTDPATTKVLVENRIIPTPVRPAKFVPRWGWYRAARHGFVLKYRFPITGGQIDPATLAGTIDHSGGLKFRNLRNGKYLKVTDFIIDTVNAQLTADVGGARVPILDLDLSQIKVKERGRYTIISGVGATLTAVAADALNATLETDIFAEGLKLGTAKVKARFAK
jgi:hypothetical protein